MGTARAPVVGSGRLPACTARVRKPHWWSCTVPMLPGSRSRADPGRAVLGRAVLGWCGVECVLLAGYAVEAGRAVEVGGQVGAEIPGVVAGPGNESGLAPAEEGGAHH